MDILLQFAIFLIVLGAGRLITSRRSRKRLIEVQSERDMALTRLKELQR
jgi:hypothetical protein